MSFVPLTGARGEALESTSCLQKNRLPIALIATGIIVALGGLFLTLAAAQVLPQGVNAISSLGVSPNLWGWVIPVGIGMIAPGIFLSRANSIPTSPIELSSFSARPRPSRPPFIFKGASLDASWNELNYIVIGNEGETRISPSNIQ